jgi:long-chain acyl-CoA synthetase
MNIASLLHAAARSYPDRPAVALGHVAVHSYAKLAERVSSLASALLGRFRLIPGDRVGLAMLNHPYFIEVMWACWHAGLVVVPVNARLHTREIGFILDNAEAVLCFTTDQLSSTIDPLVGEITSLRSIVNIQSNCYQSLCQFDPIPYRDVPSNAPAWLFYTSGTTGRPKGAVLSHRALLAMTWRYFADIDNLSPADTIIHATPLSHATGLFSIPFVAKAAQHIVPNIGSSDVGDILELADRQPNTSFILSPTMLIRMSEHPAAKRVKIENIKTIMYGSAPIHASNVERALDVFGPRLWQGYGQGEAPNTITYLSKAMHSRYRQARFSERLQSVGIARTGVEVRVTDVGGRNVPDGEIGEIVCRSDVMMSSYWKNPKATAEAFHNDWLRTGDLGVLSADGLLTLKDRAKDVIIVEGLNIYPREVENVLLSQPDVREAAVVGRKHALSGEEIVAFVVKTPESNLTDAILDRLCLDQIAPFKKPSTYVFVDELPKNGSGKILKTELRRRLEVVT